jgi:hypothetical protein
MRIEIIGDISDVTPIAVGRRIRELPRLQRLYGPGRWRKLKGMALVRVEGGEAFHAEVHWYEASGIGRKELKLKRILGD